MAHFLHGYDYEPEYTAEKVKARLFLVPPLHCCLFTIEL